MTDIDKLRQEKAIEMAKNGGYSLERIRDESGYSSCLCVTQLLRKRGIKPFPKTENRIKKENRNYEVLTFRALGFSHNEIAERLNTNTAVIASVLCNFGIRGPASEDIRKKQIFIKTCKWCGEKFETDNAQKIFCSNKCGRASGHKKNDIIRRARKAAAVVDNDISLLKVCKMANGVCALCGELVDWSDIKVVNGKKHASRLYPTIDHIIPLASGGLHSWNNVQLAHQHCNSSKQNRYGS